VRKPIVHHPASPPIDERVAAAAAGDRDAAHALLTELLPRVRNLIRYLVRGDGDVDEIAQLVLLQLLRSFHTYRAAGSLRAWTDRITARVTLAHIKSRRRWRSWQVSMSPELYAVPAQGAAPDEYLSRRQAMKALDALPDEQRHAVIMHHVAGFSVPELAEELCIPTETVRSRLRLGIKRLRVHMQETGDPRS
jgi:RNA polymerase sigma-70 factor (ECF subfamily)